MKIFQVVSVAIFLSLIAIIYCSNSLADKQPEIVIGTSYKNILSTPEQNGVLDLIAKEAFHRIGYQARVPYLPAERSLMAANSGLHDGELNRVDGMETLYPNLIRVPESTMDFHFVAIVKDNTLSITDWGSLKGYRIGFVKGWKIVEQHIKGFPRVTQLHSAKQLFRHLEVGKIDVIIYGKLMGIAIMADLEITDLTILEPALEKRKMYMYLHHKHKGLVNSLADSLRSLKEDGTYDAIFTKGIEPYKEYLSNETN